MDGHRNWRGGSGTGLDALRAAAPRALAIRGDWHAVRATAFFVLLVTIALVAGSIALVASDATEAGVLRADQLEAAGLHRDVLQQAGALDEYLSTGAPGLLDLYQQGAQRMDASLARLQGEPAQAVPASRLAATRAAAAAWRDWAEAARARAATNTPQERVAAVVEGAQVLDTFETAERQLEDGLGASADQATATVEVWAGFGLLALLLGAGTLGALLRRGAERGVRRHLRPVLDLATAARVVAQGGAVPAGTASPEDEGGSLGGALAAWRGAAAERDALAGQAPLGVCWVDPAGQVVRANRTLAEMVGIPVSRRGGSIWTVVHQDDAGRVHAALAELAAGRTDPVAVEARLVRPDGSAFWARCEAAHAGGRQGAPGTLVVTVRDVSGRRRELERAAGIQRALLPGAAPELEGYELAGGCLAAEEAAGDCVDWSQTKPGCLDLSLVDVAGRGVAAGLLTAGLRAALRAAPADLGPAARVARAAASMSLGDQDEGQFARLFHARLELSSGLLQYVDAGCGQALVRRPGGTLRRLGERSLPLGVWPGQAPQEGSVRLRPGDVLVVHSDGLAEVELGPALEQAQGASEAVERLLAAAPGAPADDVSVVVLRRLPAGARPAGTPRLPEAQPARATAPAAVTAAAGRPDEAEPDGAGRRWLPRGRTHLEWFRIVSGIAIASHVFVVSVVGLTTILAAIDFVRADRLRAGELHAVALHQDVFRQQAALGFYLATGDSSPYTDGRQDLAAAQQRVHQDLAGLPVDAEVAQVDAAIASWQALADDMERRPAGSDPAGDAFRSGQGSQLLTALDASASALAGSTDPVARQAGAEGTTAWMLGLVVLLAGSGGATGAIRLLMDRLMTGGLIPTGDLEGAAEQVALTGSATIPHLDLTDEIGDAARALREWQAASWEREVLLERNPVGLGILDTEGRVRRSNAAFRALFGRTDGAFVDGLLPGDRPGAAEALRGVTWDGREHAALEVRCPGPAGEIRWCSLALVARASGDGVAAGPLVTARDVSGRRRELARAAEIQRALLPGAAPELDGYELAGACVAAEEAAGDCYDWSEMAAGCLDLSLVDVTGRGVAAGLLTAGLRAALRAADADLGPGTRVARAAESMSLGDQDDGQFARLFQARLELSSGLLRYVDAGYGQALVRRSGGGLERLGERSLPLGASTDPEPGLREGSVRLEPGDVLVVHSDGLAEGRLSPALEQAQQQARGARETVEQLLAAAPHRPADDVSVLVLRRLAEPVPAGRS